MTGRTIPWPVKSGLLRDVNRDSVTEFIRKAMSSEDTAEKKFILINAETKKWHTDKVMQHFGRDTRVNQKNQPNYAMKPKCWTLEPFREKSRTLAPFSPRIMLALKN